VRVLHYCELESRLDRSGIGTAVDQQRRALELADADVILETDPWNGRPGRTVASEVLGADAVGERGLGAVDLVHLNVIGPGSLTLARLARRRGVPVIAHAHVTREDFRNSFRGSNLLAPALGRYLRWYYSKADLVLCPSEHTRSILVDYPVRAPIRSITNGVDLESLDGADALREEYRDRFDLEGMVVFSVGNVFERKGLSTFCELARETEYDFAWFGPYDTGPQASAAVRKWTNNPPENVTFTGWVDDKRGAFGAGDVFCFPTTAENQGIAVLEAMACGKAVVLARLPVFEEYYTDGEDCLMCESRSEFRDALDRLAADPDLRERLGENARATAREHGLDRVGDRLVESYRDVVEGRPTGDDAETAGDEGQTV
jgi:1,2-diacylglycerol-3-alpha-glucose alpha-1,2-glucosyltransferase